MCGLCGKLWPEDSAALFIQLRTMTRRLVRMPCCAGDAPPDLPQRIKRSFPSVGDFASLQAAAPKRTRGALKAAVNEWMPYRDSE